MKKIVLAVALVCLSSTVAFAKTKGTPTPQNHSCMLSGAVVEKTKKECTKAGGKWEKNATTTTPVETKAVETKPVESAPVEAPATK
jgi:hypothetical protein